MAQLVNTVPAMRETSVRPLGWEDSPREGKGNTLQYSWASLMAQLVNDSPAMRDTWVRSLGQEDTLEKGKAAHSSILDWRIPESDMTERLN